MTVTIQDEQIIRQLRRILKSHLSISDYDESVVPVHQNFPFKLLRDIQTPRQMYNFPATSSEFL